MAAKGGVDAYASFSARSQLWDLAAGQVILCEAGGTISTTAGQCLIAGPPVLHDQLARLLEEP